MWIWPRILAHRGGGTLAPENTYAALRCGMAAGFRAIEFDVMLARDGVPVVMHDPGLGRTVKGRGSVFEHDARELAAMDAGSWFGPAFAGEPVPLLADFIGFCRQHGIWMNIEIKPAPGYEAQTGHAVARMTAALFADASADAPAETPLLSSFSDVALAAARNAAPDLPRACLMSALGPGWQARAAALEVRAIHTNHLHLSRDQARAVKDAGYALFCYTVNDPGRARELVEWGVDAFCTDRIDLIAPDFV